MRTVFISGATGFVGSHTAAKFLREGLRVKALVRRPDRPALLPAKVEPVVGDLLEADRYRAALSDCDAVIHVAGLVRGRTEAEYRRANADGAAVLARAAAESCPKAMFVLVSSQAAAGPARAGQPITEADPPQPVSWYGRSKLEGEEAVARHYPGPWCAIRPSIVYGGDDSQLLELFTIIQKGWAPVLAGGRTRTQLIAVEDLADILFAAADRPDLSHRRAFAAGEVATTGELAAAIAQLRSPPARMVPVPAVAVRAAGWFESARQWVTGRVRPFNRDKARDLLQRDWLCDAGPLLRDIGITELKPWRQGIREVCRCYVTAGWLRPSVWTV